MEYEVYISMLEIYNEKLQDLLTPINKRPTGGLKIRGNEKIGIFYIENVHQNRILRWKPHKNSSHFIPIDRRKNGRWLKEPYYCNNPNECQQFQSPYYYHYRISLKRTTGWQKTGKIISN